MEVGILVIESTDYVRADFDVRSVSELLEDKGYDVKQTLFVDSKSDVLKSVEFLKDSVQSIIVCGNTSAFYEAYAENYTLGAEQKIVDLENVIFAFMPVYSKEFLSDSVLPALNSKAKTFYNTVVFRTFGVSEAQLRDMLKEQIKNKNRITFRFCGDYPECAVKIKYSSKTSKPVVDSIVVGTAEILKDVTYAHEDISLANQVADVLKVRKKTVCVAESFTGGGVTNALVKIDGISSVLREGLVTYANESKIKRLGVEKEIIEHYGAVSIETVYEMAANIIMENDCDYSVATTGNAGPTSEKEGDVGLCFIAVGTRNGIHIYKYKFDGNREKVMECGAKAALFHLYKKLTESEFTALADEFEQNRTEN